MPKNLFTANVDHTSVDNLISGTLIPCKVIPAVLEAEAGVIKRGTPLTTGDGEVYYKYNGEGDIHGVLMLDIDTDDEDECVGAPVAFGGEFNQNKIEEALESSLTPLVVAAARARQIFIAPMEQAPEAFTGL